MTIFKKSVAAFVLAAAAFGIAGSAKAQTPTIESLMQQIAQLTAQIAQMQGGTTTTTTTTTCGTTYGYTATSTLRPGMSGSAVSALQTALNMYAGASLTVDGSFGPATSAAVRAFQTSKGLTADAIAGAATQGALVNASMMAGTNCGTGNNNNGGSTSTGTLNGGAGDITVDLSSSYSNEEVGEGEEDVAVLAFDIEADDESDVEITSIKVEFSQNTSADSEKLEDYADEVSVWFDGEKVGSVDADDFNESSDVYSRNISLDGVIIEAGDEMELVIAVSALNNLDSGDIDTDQFNVGVSSIRFMDGDGVVTTENYTLDVTDGAADDELEKLFSFEDFAGATDVELRAALENEDINDARVLNVDDTNDTKHEILSFTLEARGDSDITIEAIPFVITTTGETDESVIVLEANLWMDGEEIATENVPSNGVVTFDDLDITIDAGDEMEFVLEVELADTDGALDDGDTVQATLTIASIDAEDEAGDSLASGDLTGSAVGDAHAAYEVGFDLELVSATEVKTVTSDTSGTGDQAQFVIKYKVTAFDGDIWVDNTCVEDNDGSEVSTATSYSITNNGSNSTTCVTTSTGDTVDGDAFLIEEGTSETITLTVNATASADAFAQVVLEAIGWDYAAGGDDEVYSFNLVDFKTDPLFLNLF